MPALYPVPVDFPSSLTESITSPEVVSMILRIRLPRAISGADRLRSCLVAKCGVIAPPWIGCAEVTSKRARARASPGPRVGDPVLTSNLTRRMDFTLLMVEALVNDQLIREAPAIVGCRTPSALGHAASVSD